ncbi:UNVERIFIED_CONTAM: hypothetical protein FKN15_036784 [Acipenser sinensis]
MALISQGREAGSSVRSCDRLNRQLIGGKQMRRPTFQQKSLDQTQRFRTTLKK